MMEKNKRKNASYVRTCDMCNEKSHQLMKCHLCGIMLCEECFNEFHSHTRRKYNGRST